MPYCGAVRLKRYEKIDHVIQQSDRGLTYIACIGIRIGAGEELDFMIGSSTTLFA